MKVAVSGATGKTGVCLVEELLSKGHEVRLLTRSTSVAEHPLNQMDRVDVDFTQPHSLDAALQGMDALLIASGARPSLRLLDPWRVDAKGVIAQVESCKRVGVRRVILISSIATGRWFHPLNVFGLVLVQKKKGELALMQSGLQWTTLRPGQLIGTQSCAHSHGLKLTGMDQQMQGSIPRCVLASFCVSILSENASHGACIELTSSVNYPVQSIRSYMQSLALNSQYHQNKEMQ